MDGKDTRDPERAIERHADELEHDISGLDDDIREAKAHAHERAKEAGTEEGPVGDVAGDWKGEARTDDDPSAFADDD